MKIQVTKKRDKVTTYSAWKLRSRKLICVPSRTGHLVTVKANMHVEYINRNGRLVDKSSPAIPANVPRDMVAV